MIAKILAKIMGTNNARQLRRLQPLVNKINELERDISSLSDERLALKTNEFRQRLDKGEKLDSLLPEAFAVVRETAKRQIGQRHYDVQLIGGIVLHQGKIAEMRTGEGKTLAATLPLYLNALEGKGAHLVTVNDYLAKRDSEWMGPIYNFLGLEVGALQNSSSDSERKGLYQKDILYATNNELGFDYLRDNMKFRLDDYVQRELNFAIVDEVDSILIDEARTPLIISGAGEEDSGLYMRADKAAKRLSKGQDFEVDEKARAVHINESGVDKVEDFFSIDNLYDVENLSILHHVSQALKAHSLFRLDVDYVIKDGQVLIVDEFTGRVLPGRRYSDGLHQALEAKEGVQIEKESHTLASITLQNLFRLYKKLAGMTGTAATEAEEFHRIYKLDVVIIPTNRPLIRKDQSDYIFLSQNAKFKAIVEDIKERHEKGQPVLIGTVAVETSELLSNIFTVNGVPHEVLNAKQHAREADIVAHAGEPGRVTIATNMAGRGTDIKLTQDSLKAGGLYILGTERHESRRIDNQLRGRAGRQGDPGESRFYISLDDDLIRIFAGETLKKRMTFFGMKEDEIIESRFVSKTIQRSQEKVEKHNFDIRKHLIEYDDVMNQQRKVVYNFRRTVLAGEGDIYELIRDLIIKAITTLVAEYCPKRKTTPEEVKGLFVAVSRVIGFPVDILEKQKFDISNSETLKKDLIDFILASYDMFRKQQDQEVIKEAEKWMILETIDQAWKQHMVNIDHLKEGIGLRGWGQKNPLIEYKRESFSMFQDMMKHVRRDIMHHLFHINLEHFDSHGFEERREKELEEINMVSSDPTGTEVEQRVVEDKVGRNDPCPCGSGKKYKKCCMK
ncbi:preprotein translocase subunit SecA [Candidatus Dependentiae bacterium]